MREGLAHEGLEDGRRGDGESGFGFFSRGLPDVRDFYRLPLICLDQGLRPRPQLADGGGNLFAAKTEALLEGLREVHPVEAVEADVFEQGRRRFLVVGERAL